MIHVSNHAVDLWADDLYLSAGCKTAPVDLHAIARYRRVKRLEIRLMVRSGTLVPVHQGYEISLQGVEPRELKLDEPEIPEELNIRQRFTLAHEIAHTYFYKGTDRVPIPTVNVKTKKDSFDLENICDRAAKRILVPMRLLRSQVRAVLGESSEVDVSLVRRMVSRFKVPYEVILDRLRTMEPENQMSRCILLVRKDQKSKPKVMGLYMGIGLLSVLPPIRRKDLLTNWFKEFPEEILKGYAPRDSRVMRKGRELIFRRTPLRDAGDFLLQIDDLRPR